MYKFYFVDVGLEFNCKRSMTDIVSKGCDAISGSNPP